MAKILLIENYPPERQVYFNMLRTWGYKVDECETVSAAKGFITANSYDLFVLDLQIPLTKGKDSKAHVTHGIKLFEVIRKQPGKIPVIIISAYIDKKSVLQKVTNDSNLEILEKPFNFEHWKKTIKKLLDKNG